MVEQIQGYGAVRPVEGRTLSARVRPVSTPFATVFDEALQGTPRLRFSAHALQRLDERRLTLSAADEARVARAVDEAAGKGSREALVLLDRLALVVSVPNRTVITVVPPDASEDTVFTNIDSVVLVAAAREAPVRP